MIKSYIGKLNFNDLTKLSNKLDKIEYKLGARSLPERLVGKEEEAKALEIDIPKSCVRDENYLRLIEVIGTDLSNKVTMTPVPLEGISDFPAQQTSHKPAGLWYACGNDWMQWVCRQMPHWIGKYIYTLEVDYSKVLKIETEEQFKDFEDKYLANKGFEVDWAKVVAGSRREGLEGYSGIEICPMQYGNRWYSSWDVSSGCIWDPSAIKRGRLIAKQTMEIDRSEYEADYEEHWDTGPRKGESANWEWYGLEEVPDEQAELRRRTEERAYPLGADPAESGRSAPEANVREDFTREVSENIMNKLKSGEKPWERPWSTPAPTSTVTTGPYHPQDQGVMQYHPQTGKLITEHKFATFIKEVPAAVGRKAVYLMEPPLVGRDGRGNEYIVVSDNSRETYIFGSDETGFISEYLDLPGSSPTSMPHKEVLNNIGYNVK